MRSSCARRRRLELCPSWTPRPRNQTSNPEGRGPAIFEIGFWVCAEILPLDTQNLLRKSSTASLAGVTFQPSVVFALFFHLIRDLAHGRRASPLAAGEGQDRGEEGIVAGFDPFAIPPTPAPHDDTVSTLVPNHPGRVSFSAVVSWLAARLELWEHAEVQPGLASSMAAPSVARACIAFPLPRSILPLDSCVWISLSMMMHHRALYRGWKCSKFPRCTISGSDRVPNRCCSLQKVIRNRQVGARGDRPRPRGRPLPPPAPWTASPDRRSHSP